MAATNPGFDVNLKKCLFEALVFVVEGRPQRFVKANLIKEEALKDLKSRFGSKVPPNIMEMFDNVIATLVRAGMIDHKNGKYALIKTYCITDKEKEAIELRKQILMGRLTDKSSRMDQVVNNFGSAKNTPGQPKPAFMRSLREIKEMLARDPSAPKATKVNGIDLPNKLSIVDLNHPIDKQMEDLMRKFDEPYTAFFRKKKTIPNVQLPGSIKFGILEDED